MPGRPVPHTSPALLALALAGCALLACAGGKGAERGPKVQALDIEGDAQVSEGDIEEKILTGPSPWYEKLNPFDGGPKRFDPLAWQADLRRIERYYQARGYYQARVLRDEVSEEGDSVRLKVVVDEGAPTTVGTVELRGLEALPEEHRAAATADLPLTPGEVFLEEEWALVKGQVRARLRELGYAEAEVGGEAQVDVDTHQARVVLEVTPGPRYRFGAIFVATDPDPEVSHKRVIEQAQGSIRRDAWYSDSALAEAQQRVFRMGVFGAVKVNRGAPDPESKRVPVVVDVRESPFRSLRLGGGVGLESERNEVRGIAEFTHRNFLGNLRRLTLRTRLGYAFIPDVLDVARSREGYRAGPVFEVTGEVEQPRFLFRDVRGQASLSVERGLERSFSFEGLRARTGLAWEPRPFFTFTGSVNVELYRLHLEAGGATDVLTSTASVAQTVLGCREGLEGRGASECSPTLTYLEQTAEWDRRDSRTEPTRGYYASLSLQEGGPPGSFDYFRVQGDVRGYRSFLEDGRLTLGARVRAGTVHPLGGEDTSVTTRFFSGGGASMRGFNGRALSPQVEVGYFLDHDDRPETPPVLRALRLPTGGLGLLETNLEARTRVTENLLFATFYDTGSVTTESLGSATLSRVYHAVGLGLRYLSVVGPLRLDLAFRLPNAGPPLETRTLLPAQTPSGEPFVDAEGNTALDPATGEPYALPTDSSAGRCLFFRVTRATDYAGYPTGLCSIHISIGEAF